MGRTAEFFSHYAPELERIYCRPNIADRIIRGSMFIRQKKVLVGCQPVTGETIIDIGCGTGDLAVELAKRGTNFVLGVDFAQGMLELARKKALVANLDHNLAFVLADFLEPPLSSKIKFDYALVLGVMDYVENPREFINKVISFTQTKAFFSFPKDGGALVLLRRAIYRGRCPLFLYTLKQTEGLFSHLAEDNQVTIEDTGKEFFVTVERK